VDNASGDHEALPGLQRDVAILEIDVEFSFDDIEELIVVVVLVPVILALHDTEPNDRVIHPAQRLVIPLVGARVHQRLHVYQLELAILDVEMSGVGIRCLPAAGCFTHDAFLIESLGITSETLLQPAFIMAEIADTPRPGFPQTRSPEQAGANRRGYRRGNEEGGCDARKAQSQTEPGHEEAHCECSDSGLPEVAARCPAPPPTDLPGQHTSRQDEPPWAGVTRSADGADQQGGDKGSHEESDWTAELVEPGAAHVASE